MSNNRVKIEEAVKLYGLAGVHPAADLFPMMSGDEYDNLVESVRERGFAESVEIDDKDLLIDGRNRLCASLDVGVDVHIKRFQPTDTIAYVVDKNLHRRHLTAGQKAMMGTAIERAYAEEAKERQREAGGDRGNQYTGGKVAVVTTWSQAAESDQKSRKKAADVVGVGEQSIQRAKTVDRHEDLKTEVVSGQKPLNTAYREAKEREKLSVPVETEKPSQEMIQLEDHKGNLIEYPKPKGKPTFNKTNDAIQWASFSWNPVTGCLHGCDYCYAREIAHSPTFGGTFPIGFDPLFRHDRLDAPKNTSPIQGSPEGGRVFVCSMADLFGEWVPDHWIEKVMESVRETEQWKYLFLTKNPKRYKRVDIPKNAWVGATVDSQAKLSGAIESLRSANNAEVRWISLEPLTEPMSGDFSGIDWIVIGARSATVQPDGKKVPSFAPPFEWVMDLVLQARSSGTRVYMKQNLLGQVNSQWPGMNLIQETP